ncbi:unnamed protein product (macronuclear) [Paramecium tetraurelia]|uniref:Uncharacterized protein n=1 Tax=Paramecium tetraurelia TaxID=5888 RepID=A0BUQ3_PARTE|nr:uncharacterized protein GSPATT00005516001 [Paramecium tetraurelia]CAK62270.1 unnamed protein product [Paramecium tetraurelia]|eukprot:XP_001429668.1 hypothetical protein (macronuclear) [Paramecium tetraurelia strain d4-2]
MAFVKLVKGTPYFKRFQTKFRRRREGKTDYYARSRLIVQDKDKYNSPKYRFVVRHTNTKIICQVIYATLKGDKVVAAAESTELKRFGLTSGLTNYAAAYATGLLLARRTLKTLKMDKFYEGNKTIDGNLKTQRERPFFAVLDIGLVRSTLGNRVFAALKGAADGGIHIPHNNRRFPGFSVDNDKKEKYDANVHKDRIFGVHVDKYMALLQKEKKTNQRWKILSLMSNSTIGNKPLKTAWCQISLRIGSRRFMNENQKEQRQSQERCQIKSKREITPNTEPRDQISQIKKELMLQKRSTLPPNKLLNQRRRHDFIYIWYITKYPLSILLLYEFQQNNQL